jgi:arylsulfatase A-like enzyme
MTAHGIDFMERQVKAKKPFYLQMSHYPYQEEKGGRKNAEGGARGEDMGLVDKTVGQILDAIERLGLMGSTYIVYTTDHGTPGRNAPLTGGKGGVWEGGLRVPFIVAGPGVKAGVCSHVRVSATDLLPTFASLAGIKDPLPKGVEGGSFASVLLNGGTGAVKRPREEFVVHFPHYDKDWLGPASAILLGDYKLIRVYETDERKLFDLSKHITERNDLAKQMPAKVTELDQRLTDYLKAVNAQMPTINPNADPSKTADTLPGEKKGGKRGGKGGRGGEPPGQSPPQPPSNQ